MLHLYLAALAVGVLGAMLYSLWTAIEILSWPSRP
jgi:hypothetical protein